MIVIFMQEIGKFKQDINVIPNTEVNGFYVGYTFSSYW